ncbi:MAG: cupin domain-containing protein [Phycisphaerales bacterium]|nr:cupin domain-containing protein [Phycisphaerales bacterium]
MAAVYIPAQNRTLDAAVEIQAFLAPLGLTYERWPVQEKCSPDAPAEEILAAYAPEIATLKERGGYVTADVIDIKPELPGLDALLAKFSREHRHTEDEVRFIVKGRGLFHLHPEGHDVFSITVESGDLLTVPAGMRHWFDLCVDRTIRAIRLFQDPAGWTPFYEEQGLHNNFEPVCWGPSYLPPGGALPGLVR